MKKQSFGKPLCRVIMAVAIMLLSLQAMAYDFSYTYQGKTLYYEILAGSTNTLAVTYYSETAASNNHVSGDVVIPSSVEHNNVTYSVTSIGNSAFRECSGLTSVTIPNSVTFIGNSAFRECSGLTSVTIPNSVTSIGNSAFYRCSGLTSVTIPNSVTFIGNSAFRECSGLTSVSIPNSVTSIGNSAFYYCIGLTSVNIPNSVTSIENWAFSYCSGLTSVTIPNSVASIGNSAFYRCSGLTSVTIPNSVTTIGESAFADCSSLNSINVASGNTHYSSIDGVLYNYVQDTLMQCPGAKTSLTIPNSVTSIGNNAFLYCRGLTSITIPNSVTSIGNDAFYNCSGLTSLTIPNSVTSIGNNAFSYCRDLTSVKCLASIPPSIGNNSFQNISDTCTLTVPCSSLEAYTASDWNTYFAARIIIEEPLFELSVSANDEAYGRVEVETQSCNVKTLTAIANEGYSFLTWSDGNTENPRTVSITSDTAFMAIFTEAVSTPTITLTVNNEAMGSASYTLDGNTAVLTATANEGYSFLTWSDGNMENPRTVTITSDTAFMAIFTASSSSSLQEVNAREFVLYPNPAKSFVTLEFEALEENTLLQILDINGRKVRTFDLKAGQECLRIEIGNLSEGVYTIMLGNAAKKLIVE